MELTEGQRKEIATGQGVFTGARISIKKKGNKGELWPIMGNKANETIRVWVLPRTDQLEITLNIIGDHRNKGGGAFYKYRSDTKKLTCEKGKLNIRKNGEGEVIYGKTMRYGGRGRGWIPNSDGTLKVGISLQHCENKGETAECSLKVVT